MLPDDDDLFLGVEKKKTSNPFQGYGAKEWVYFVVCFGVAIAGYKLLYEYFGITKYWAMLIFVTPFAVIGYFINRKREKAEKKRRSGGEDQSKQSGL